MPVHLSTKRLRRRSVAPARVRRAAERMLESLDMIDAELSILLCDDATIQELNRDFRAKDRPTDVLAFAMREGEGGGLHPELLGDVVISVETARAAALLGGRPIAQEVIHLLAHGLLHLLGHDHRDEAEERRMRAMTEALVAASSPRRGLPIAERS